MRPAPTDRPVEDFGQDLDHLAARAAAGERRAQRALVSALLPRVRNLVRYMVRGDDLVDDLSQDVLVTVLQRLHTFRGDARVETWVHGVAVRVILAGLRKLRKRHRREVSVDGAEPLPLWASGPQADTLVERRRALAFLDQLPDKQRHALVMHHVLGMRVADVAKELGVPVETVRSRLREGRAKLRTLGDVEVPSRREDRRGG